jgi:hypothetical protein
MRVMLTGKVGCRSYTAVTRLGRNGGYVVENYKVEVREVERCEECVRRLMEGLLVSRARAVRLVDILRRTGGRKDPHDHASVDLVRRIRAVDWMR